MVAATVASGPRYAPHDPSLPEPWRALVDGNTGYIYYWNPETNVTQYEKPAPPPPPPPPPPLPAGPPPAVSTPKLAPIPANPSLHSQNSAPVGGPSHVEQSSRSGNERVDANNNTNNSIINNGVMPGQPKLAAIPVPRSHQGMGEMRLSHAPTGQLNAPGTSVGLGTRSAMFKRGPNDYSYPGQDFKRPRMHGFSDTPNASDVEAYRRQHEITAMGENVPAPFMTFDVAGFPPEILRELQNAGFSCPTPIQAQSWPVALQSRDIVAIAKTGSGKTLGYLLPAFLHLGRRRNNSQMGPTVLVLAPTRELATQIQDEAVKFGRSSRITSTCVYGGAPKVPQLRDLERGADIVVATPGRLNDFLEVKKVNLQQVSFLVLDEADRMLDMGFEPQIRKIVNEIPPQRQTLMYTATWPKEVRKIAGDLLVNPVQVHIGSVDELSANKSITQYVEVVAVNEKQRRLEQILRSQEPGSKVIIFCSTKRMCDQLSRSIGRQFGAAAIHGDKSQTERDWVLTQFRTGRTPVLVATDVAARGLDIKDIRVVINFDFPTGIEDYVHRIGRTGRAGATGLSYTFFSDQDAKYAQELIKVLEGANQRVPPDLRDMAARSGYMRARGGRWDSGGRTGRDGGRVGRGDGSRGGRGDGGRGYGGGRGEVYGVRGGGWGRSEGRSDRQERSYDKFGGHGRFERDARNRYESVRDRYDRDGRDRHEKDGRDRYFDDRDRLRDGFRKFDDRERGRSYSRSYSRSPSRSRGRSYSRSWGRSYSRSRSRSRSYDRYNHKSISRRGSSPVNVTVNSTLNAGPPERNDSPRNVPPRVFSPRKGSSPHTLVSTYRDVSPPGNRTPHRVDPSHQVGSEYCDDLSYADGSPPRSRH